jgi:hypothetical protein
VLSRRRILKSSSKEESDVLPKDREQVLLGKTIVSSTQAAVGSTSSAGVV